MQRVFIWAEMAAETGTIYRLSLLCSSNNQVTTHSLGLLSPLKWPLIRSACVLTEWRLSFTMALLLITARESMTPVRKQSEEEDMVQFYKYLRVHNNNKLDRTNKKLYKRWQDIVLQISVLQEYCFVCLFCTVKQNIEQTFGKLKKKCFSCKVWIFLMRKIRKRNNVAPQRKMLIFNLPIQNEATVKVSLLRRIVASRKSKLLVKRMKQHWPNAVEVHVARPKGYMKQNVASWCKMTQSSAENKVIWEKNFSKYLHNFNKGQTVREDLKRKL